jgi:hypothetical protein
MAVDPQDLPDRRPVWEALSGLFLDTDVSSGLRLRVEVLAGSPYALAQLQAILLDEVYPVCKYNLYAVAGEWAGFDLDWLQARILAHQASVLRRFNRFSLGRRAMARSSEWRDTLAGVQALRGSPK